MERDAKFADSQDPAIDPEIESVAVSDPFEDPGHVEVVGMARPAAPKTNAVISKPSKVRKRE
jgi:hypothetical protein